MELLCKNYEKITISKGPGDTCLKKIPENDRNIKELLQYCIQPLICFDICMISTGVIYPLWLSSSPEHLPKVSSCDRLLSIIRPYVHHFLQTTYLKPLAGSCWNFAWMFLERSSTKVIQRIKVHGCYGNRTENFEKRGSPELRYIFL